MKRLNEMSHEDEQGIAMRSGTMMKFHVEYRYEFENPMNCVA